MAPYPPPKHSESVERFRRNYLDLLEKAKVAANARPWYRRRIEGYLAMHQGKRLARHEAGDVERFLDAIDSEGSLEDWQFRQAADALRILFCELARAPWAASLDWSRWIDLSVRLAPDYPTTARDTESMAGAARDAGPAGSFAPADAEAWVNLRARISAAIRVRGYSIRTEKTYVHWVARFLHFHGDNTPEALSGAAVASFLEHLAMRRKGSAST